METPTFIGISRQMALRNRLDVVANNVANLNTPGFKKETLLFSEHIVRPDGRDRVQEPLSLVVDRAQFRDTGDGIINYTGGTFDVALQGPGFFGVQGPGGEQVYTRAGNFTLSADGELVTPTGDLVLDQGGGTITIPTDQTNFTIDGQGNIFGQDGQVATLMVREFDDVQSMETIGRNYLTTDEAGRDSETTTVTQGAIEGSNVNGVSEVTQMIDVLRSYQGIQNFIQSEHDRQRSMIRALSDEQ